MEAQKERQKKRMARFRKEEMSSPAINNHTGTFYDQYLQISSALGEHNLVWKFHWVGLLLLFITDHTVSSIFSNKNFLGSICPSCLPFPLALCSEFRSTDSGLRLGSALAPPLPLPPPTTNFCKSSVI